MFRSTVSRSARLRSTKLRSNVVSVLFSTPECRSAAAGKAEAAHVVAFPARGAQSPESLPFDARKTIHGTFAWAAEVVAADRRLSFAIVEARKRVNRLMRETCPKPAFVAGAADYETFSAAMVDWEAARKQLSFNTGLAAMTAEWTVIQKDTAEAYEILRAAGIDPGHH
jgi:hypothetical protein